MRGFAIPLSRSSGLTGRPLGCPVSDAPGLAGLPRLVGGDGHGQDAEEGEAGVYGDVSQASEVMGLQAQLALHLLEHPLHAQPLVVGLHQPLGAGDPKPAVHPQASPRLLTPPMVGGDGSLGAKPVLGPLAKLHGVVLLVGGHHPEPGSIRPSLL